MNAVVTMIFGLVLLVALVNIDTEPGRRVAISYLVLPFAYLSVIASSTNVVLVVGAALKSVTAKNEVITKILNILFAPIAGIGTVLGIIITITFPSEIIGKVMNIAGRYPEAMPSTTLSATLAGVATLSTVATIMFFTWKKEIIPKLISMLLVNPVTAYVMYALIFNITSELGWVFTLPEPTSIFRNWW